MDKHKHKRETGVASGQAGNQENIKVCNQKRINSPSDQ